MTPRELLTLFRSEMRDQKAPYLWGDPELYQYMVEAQEKFARETGGIADASTPAICQLAITAGQDWYPTSKRILDIRGATRADTGRPVRIMNAEKAPREGVLFDGRPGPLNTLVIGLEKHKLRAWPVPSEALVVNLSTYRLPLTGVSGAADSEFEIDDQYHYTLIHWMKFRAFSKDDTETLDLRRAAENEKRFLDECRLAKAEITRQERDVSTVSYGGI